MIWLQVLTSFKGMRMTVGSIYRRRDFLLFFLDVGYTGCSFALGKKDDNIDVETDHALKGVASVNLDDEDSKGDDTGSVNIEPISAMTALEQPEWRIEE